MRAPRVRGRAADAGSFHGCSRGRAREHTHPTPPRGVCRVSCAFCQSFQRLPQYCLRARPSAPTDTALWSTGMANERPTRRAVLPGACPGGKASAVKTKAPKLACALWCCDPAGLIVHVRQAASTRAEPATPAWLASSTAPQKSIRLAPLFHGSLGFAGAVVAGAAGLAALAAPPDSAYKPTTCCWSWLAPSPGESGAASGL